MWFFCRNQSSPAPLLSLSCALWTILPLQNTSCSISRISCGLCLQVHMWQDKGSEANSERNLDSAFRGWSVCGLRHEAMEVASLEWISHIPLAVALLETNVRSWRSDPKNKVGHDNFNSRLNIRFKNYTILGINTLHTTGTGRQFPSQKIWPTNRQTIVLLHPTPPHPPSLFKKLLSRVQEWGFHVGEISYSITIHCSDY